VISLQGSQLGIRVTTSASYPVIFLTNCDYSFTYSVVCVFDADVL